MRRILLSCSLIFVLIITNLSAQTAEDSWVIGFGGSYPRYQSSDLRPLESNYGGYLSIQRNFTEYVGLRLKGFYYNIEGRIPGGVYFYDDGTAVPSGVEEIPNTLIGGNLDLLYYFSPCKPITPYFYFGAGAVSYDPDWGNVVNTQAESGITAQLSFGLGAEWKLDSDWKLKTEFGYHSLNSKVDGIVNNNRQGIFGSNADAYISFDLGFQYYFSKGMRSKECTLYDGIRVDIPDLSNLATKDDVEDIVQRYIPKEVVKEVVVEKPVASKANWILVGVNFDLGSASLRPEAYPVLFHAVQVLLSNPDMKVEIQGHTDNIGSEKFNQTLSEKRAQTVKNYLVARGVGASRLVTVGYGESKPIADNKTAQGRAMNRRIEFKVLN